MEDLDSVVAMQNAITYTIFLQSRKQIRQHDDLISTSIPRLYFFHYPEFTKLRFGSLSRYSLVATASGREYLDRLYGDCKRLYEHSSCSEKEVEGLVRDLELLTISDMKRYGHLLG